MTNDAPKPAANGLLTLYLRRVPTSDETLKKYRDKKTGNARKPFDVCVYRSEEAALSGEHEAGRWMWYLTTKPRKGCKRFWYNCWQWNAIWLDDVVEIVP
jgi:hypothetical protein